MPLSPDFQAAYDFLTETTWSVLEQEQYVRFQPAQREIEEHVTVCRAILAFLHPDSPPNKASVKPRGAFRITTTSLRHQRFKESLRDADSQLFLIEYALHTYDQLQSAVEQRGDPVLQLELVQMRGRYIRLKSDIINSGKVPTYFTDLLEEYAKSRPIRFRVPQPMTETPKDLQTLSALLNQTLGNCFWNERAFRALPKGAVFIAQSADASGVWSFIYDGLTARLVHHNTNEEEVGYNVALLNREFESGTSPEALHHLGKWFHATVFDGWPKTTRLLYYVGLGAFSQLPVNGFFPWPVIWLIEGPNFRFRWFHLPLRGTALWSRRGPAPLIHTCEECQSLPNFHSGPATVNAVSFALRANNPVHLAVHAEASKGDPYETKLVLEDGELNLKMLSTMLLEAPIVFLSACETAVGSYNDVRLFGSQPPSLARTLICRGVGAVVATKWRIPDDQAMIVAKCFWSGMRLGQSPARALFEARQICNTSHAHAFELHY